MPDIWLGGGENPSHHALFTAESVAKVAINIGNLVRNHKQEFKGLALDPSIDVEWLAWTDMDSTLDDLLDVVRLVGTLPTYVFGSEEWSSHSGYLQMWNGLDVFPVNAMPQGLVIPDKVFRIKDLCRKVVSGRKRTSTLGVITGRSEGLAQFDVIVGTGWWQVAKLGELHVWDAKAEKLWRHNTRDRDAKSVEHAAAIKQLGVSHEAILNTDTEALLTLSVRSWLAYSDYLAAKSRRHVPASSQSVVTTGTNQLSPQAGIGRTSPAIVPLNLRPKLPTMRVEMQDELDQTGAVVGQLPMIRSSADSLRQCDSCNLSQACPQYHQGDPCSFSLAVEIRTPQQRQALQNAILEIQTQRVFQSRMGEEILGDGLDPATGKEMDRLFKMVDYINQGNDGGAFKVVLQGRGAAGAAAAGAGGVLSQMFGATAGENARQKVDTVPMPAELDVVDADVIP